MAPHSLLTEIRVALIFFTRLPLSYAGTITGPDFARASWASPLVGVLIGATGGLIYAVAFALNLQPLLSALLAIAATVLLTGAMHEDGLADVADGFWGGSTRDRKLAIMRDSRIGTYAGLALVFSVAIRTAAVAALATPAAAAASLIAAHAGARAVLPTLMRLLPLARSEGLAANAGEPPVGAAFAALALGLLVLVLSLGAIALPAAVAGFGAAYAMARIAKRHIGGQTGDVLGAAEQLAEVAILITAAAFA
jgi:adenosylcobinamide-GDP ribazoletransferase